MRSLKRTSLAALLGFACTVGTVPSYAALSGSTGEATARQLFAAAETKAAAGHKNVLVDFSASWCGNCKLFDRFWDDPEMHPLLSKAFERVTLIIDERDGRHQNTPGGTDVLHALGGSDSSGIPYLAMTTPQGKLIISNEKNGTPQSGIGYPDAPDEVEWFIHMLERAAPTITSQDRASIKKWLDSHATHPR